MKSIALTGGIGMGKSTVADWFRQRGVGVVDSDLIARQVVAPGQPALEEIQALFGPQLIGPDGALRRDLLARRVFADPQARQKLEALLHPRIRAVWQEQLALWRDEGRPLAMAVIPLLFETNAAGAFDVAICVACSAASQQRRLLDRGWEAAQIRQRLAAQWPIEAKMRLSHYVVWTEGSFAVTAAQLERVLHHIELSPSPP